MLESGVENVLEYVARADEKDLLSTITVSNYKDGADIDISKFRMYNQHLRKGPKVEIEVNIDPAEASYSIPEIVIPVHKEKRNIDISKLSGLKKYILFRLVELILHSRRDQYGQIHVYNFYRILSADIDNNRVLKIARLFEDVPIYDIYYYVLRSTSLAVYGSGICLANLVCVTRKQWSIAMILYTVFAVSAASALNHFTAKSNQYHNSENTVDRILDVYGKVKDSEDVMADEDILLALESTAEQPVAEEGEVETADSDVAENIASASDQGSDSDEDAPTVEGPAGESAPGERQAEPLFEHSLENVQPTDSTEVEGAAETKDEMLKSDHINDEQVAGSYNASSNQNYSASVHAIKQK